MHLYVEPLQRAKAIERLWVLYELATNFDAYGELSLGFSKKGHAELLGIARGLATEFESDARCRDGAGLRAAKARPHCATTSAATHLHPRGFRSEDPLVCSVCGPVTDGAAECKRCSRCMVPRCKDPDSPFARNPRR